MILALLRRSRLLASLLVAASPAVGGTLLPVLHPCPVDLPWLAAREHAADAGTMHHAGHQAPATDHHHDFCQCPGSCDSAPLRAAPSGGAILMPGCTRPVTPAWVSVDASLALPPPSTLLPPATAPPIG